MKAIEIFEPPVCCPTGVCGPSQDPELVALQNAIMKMKKEGYPIERIAINQQPMRVMNNPVVKAVLVSEGKASLPITLVDGKIVVKGRYPKLEELLEAVQ